jgi:hypothetical protein
MLTCIHFTTYIVLTGKKVMILMIYTKILLTNTNYPDRFNSVILLKQNFSNFNSQKEKTVL